MDDDLGERGVAAYVLRRDGFAVFEAPDGPQALRQFRLESPDLVAVSLELPLSGGVELLRQIRAENPTPVLVMVGPNGGPEVFRCLELGADDFTMRPYASAELALRIQAILRRAAGSIRQKPDVTLELGDFRLDPETHEVARGPFEIRLTPMEFRIFYMLAKNAEHAVPADRLLAYVSGSRGGAANSLRSHICHLRKKLALDGGGRGSITSVPAVGYVFRAPAWEEQDAPTELRLGQVATGS